MARLPRLAVPGLPHLVFHAGHNGLPVFADAAGCRAYVDAARQASIDEGVAVHAYSLRDSELRMLATPGDSESLSRMMQRLAQRHTVGFNQRHGRTGTVWAGRFRAAPIDPDAWLVSCMRWVEAGDVAVDPTGQAILPEVSSAWHHIGRLVDPLVREAPAYWDLGNTPFERQSAYVKLLMQPLVESARRAIARAAARGWPLGGDAFLLRLADVSGRRVSPAKPGRPSGRAPFSGPN